LRANLSEVCATRAQAEWTEVFAGTDACVAPVASLREAAASSTRTASFRRSRAAILRTSGDQTGHCPCPVSAPAKVLRAADVDVDGLIRVGAAAQA
jgi:crotonobetainyl-CoA:carnitine CoA-transferase CaiB-like acyl-CoA transferase